jgi:hypothetical protein
MQLQPTTLSGQNRMNVLVRCLCLTFLIPAPLFGQAANRESRGSLICKPLPSEIQRRLDQEFRAWKIQEPRNLSTTSGERWKSEKPQGCPGIAVGRFDGGTALSYAVLLVPREHPDAGFKFLIFSPKPGSSSFEAIVVEQSDHIGAANFFIHQVRISKFFDEPSRQKFRVGASEGILLADAGTNEYETDVYFWTNGSYQHQPVDY